jgi:hypothetical protein
MTVLATTSNSSSERPDLMDSVQRDSKLRTVVLARTSRNLLDPIILRTVVTSQSQRAETREMRNEIIEPLPTNGRLRDASLAFRRHVVYIFVWYRNDCIFVF